MIASVFAPDFASAGNAANLVSGMIPLLIVAVGQTVVVLTGGIDLSATSIMALSSVTGAMAMIGGSMGSGAVAAGGGAAVMLLVGGLAGAANGSAIAYLKMPPFIVTLVTMMLVSGLAVFITKSGNVPGIPRSFIEAGSATWFVLPAAIMLCGAGHWMLTRTPVGRWIYATGRNQRTAAASGVPVSRTLVFAYAVSGLCAAGASVLYTARLETGSPVLGQRILLDVVAAVVIGGTSLFGGRGRILWTVWGVLFITLIDNTLNLLGVSNFGLLLVKGLVILTAALLDRARSAYV